MGRASKRSAWRGGVLRKVGAVVVFAGLVMSVLPLVAGADSPSTYPWTQPTNEAEWWEDVYGPTIHVPAETNWSCTKVDNNNNLPGGYTLGSPPEGSVWRLLVVKAGSAINDLIWDPVVGQTYNHSVQGGWSHVILCSVPEEDDEEEETTTTVDEETTTTVDEETTTTDSRQVTTTTIGSTTSTVSDEVLPIVVSTTTVAPTSTVADEVEGVEVVAVTLPFTGPATEGFWQLGLALMALGALLVLATTSWRREAEE